MSKKSSAFREEGVLVNEETLENYINKHPVLRLKIEFRKILLPLVKLLNKILLKANVWLEEGLK